MRYILVGGLEHEFYFPCSIWDVILPIDELICFRGVETTNQYLLFKQTRLPATNPNKTNPLRTSESSCCAFRPGALSSFVFGFLGPISRGFHL
jgi:hypothetical protein